LSSWWPRWRTAGRGTPRWCRAASAAPPRLAPRWSSPWSDSSRCGIPGGHPRRSRPLVAGPTEELGHLHPQRGLDNQPGTEASDLLEHVDQVTIIGEQSVDLVADLLGGRYSSGHGRGSSFADWQVLKETHVRRHLHRRWDTTP